MTTIEFVHCTAGITVTRDMELLVDGPAQGAPVCLLSVRLDSHRPAVQLQPVGFLFVWASECRHAAVGLGLRHHSAQELVPLRQRHRKVSRFNQCHNYERQTAPLPPGAYPDCMIVAANLQGSVSEIILHGSNFFWLIRDFSKLLITNQPTRLCCSSLLPSQCQCQCQSNIYIAPKVEGRIWGAGVWVTRRDMQKRKGEI